MNLFLGLYLLFSVGMLLDFFMTANPYSALHSGTAALSYAVVNKTFFVSPAYLLAVALVCMTVYSRRFFLDRGVLLALALLIMSGIYTGALVSHPATYLYNALSFALIASLATVARRQNIDPSGSTLQAFIRLLAVVLVVGFLLALVFPNRYGLLTFSFSRLERGEVVLWSVLGMYALYPAMSIVVFRRGGSARYPLLSLAMTAVIVSVAYRAPAVVSLLPFVVYGLFNRRFTSKILLGCIALVSVLLFGRVIFEFLMGGGGLGSSADPTTGRALLWAYHWEVFLRSPLLGSGPAFLDRLGGYTGRAVSEVGALAWFSENGILFGGILMGFIARSVVRGIQVLARGQSASDLELLFALVVLSLVPNLLQAHGRILNADDLIFWFGVFYLCAGRVGPTVPDLGRSPK